MSTVRTLPLHVAFNLSAFSQLINSRGGRVFRLAAGAAVLVGGYGFRMHRSASLRWSGASFR